MTGKTSADGFYGLVGLGISVTGKNVALRVGGNFPTREYIDEVELVPTVGAKLSLRW